MSLLEEKTKNFLISHFVCVYVYAYMHKKKWSCEQGDMKAAYKQ
jgi:hypothetical protein